MKLKIIAVITCFILLSNIGIAQKTAEKNFSQKIQLDILNKNIQDTIKAEETEVNEIKEKIPRFQKVVQNINNDIETYKIQQTTFNSLVIQPHSSNKPLEASYNTLQIVFLKFKTYLNKHSSEFEKIQNLKANTDDQLILINNQINEVKGINLDQNESILLHQKLRLLKKLVIEKQDLLKKMIYQYTDLVDRLKVLNATNKLLSIEYREIKSKNSDLNLFDAKNNLFSFKWSQYQNKLISDIQYQIKLLGSLSYWKNKVIVIWKTNILDFFIFSLLITIVLFAIGKFKKTINNFKQHSSFQHHRSLHLPYILISKNLTIIGLLLYFIVYGYIKELSSFSVFNNFLKEAFILWLFTDWAILFLKDLKNKKLAEFPGIFKHFTRLILFVRYYLSILIIVRLIVQYGDVFSIFGRIFFHLIVLGFLFRFWKRIKSSRGVTSSVLPWRVKIAIWGYYFVILSGVLLELSGNGDLVGSWFVSWGKTIVIFGWTYLAFLAIVEYNEKIKIQDISEEDYGDVTQFQLRWVLIRIMQLIGPLLFFMAIILSWGGGPAVLTNIFNVINYQFELGTISFSILTFFYGFLVLVGTYFFNRYWKKIFQRKFLNESLIEQGLQDSITSISVYIIWIFGILLAMNVIGLNPTSLMVVFGALGIGLGFGLQNIFNNFMSGLILLFERPIQVGDDIEVNGIWATVKKINVRSTLVQTYDNAALIIPNSELINNQVTNWSHKDKRLRRQVTVGVAYGSDTQLVKQTLLEAAQQANFVLKTPKADIIFKDFGDSALIFKLRFWSTVPYVYEVESSVRFEIDKLFKAAGIVIAFPQQDVHLFHSEKQDVDKADDVNMETTKITEKK